ncbi:MAG: methyltransferase family protein [Fimbriimonadaceae bacterium]
MASPVVRFGLVALQLACLGWLGWRAARAWPWPAAMSVWVALWALWLLWSWRALGPSLSPDPKPNRRGLKTDGPYRWVRHPMYLGLLALGAGSALLDPGAAPALVGLAAALIGKVRIEERLLRQTYPEYDEYSKRSWGLVPFLW